MKLTATIVTLILVQSSSAWAQCTWTVCPGERIQAAIDGAAASGDTICLEPGIYYEGIDFKGKQIVLRSTQGPNVTAIAGLGSPYTVTFSSPEPGRAVLEGLTITGSGIINYYADPIIRDCVVAGNAADIGGAISSYGGDILVEDCEITGNQAVDVDGGGISIEGGSALIINCYIADNRTYLNYYGGGLALTHGTCVVINSVFERNWSSDGGGAWESPYRSRPNAPRLSLYNCTFIGNAVWTSCTGFGSGGGLFGGYAWNCYFAGNVAMGGTGFGFLEGRGGGAVRSYLADCLVTRNTSAYSGGGVAECTLKNTTVVYNLPDDIYNSTILP